MKYVFVTGGVVSSLGKGLVAASLGTLLEKRGLKVLLQKFDPYLNVDPGTMSPYQHGEVYVLKDGRETDLDLGHYERFTDSQLTGLNTLTSGQVFESVIRNERQGLYQGKTVQYIPHVTDEIKKRLDLATEKNPDVDILITEIGGTVGDLEGLLFLEALRQYALEIGRDNFTFIHVTLLPLIKAAGEVKTKPTQQSVAKLREIGIQPDFIVCRSETEIEEEHRSKIAMFCNVPSSNVVCFKDLEHSIYQGPIQLKKQKLDALVVDRLALETPEPDMTSWESFIEALISPTHQITVGLVGKYVELQDAYKSIEESLAHAGAYHDTRINLKRIDSASIEEEGTDILKEVDCILIPGGFGGRGIEGKISAAKYARENKVPFFGICLGMQIATIEFARNICDLNEANSTEVNADTPHPVVCLQEEQKNRIQFGASMRLGSSTAELKANSVAAEIYGSSEISERHRHRYEFNNDYKEQLESQGFVISATSVVEGLVEIVELPKSVHPHYIGVQFHPEFQSKPQQPHPLFKSFVKVALDLQSK